MGIGGRRRAALVAAAAVAAVLAACVGPLESDAGPDRTVTTPAATAPSAPDETPAGDPPARVPDDDLPEGRDTVVTSITDGDTFRSGEERVRLIGVDTPEVSGGVECYGREATGALARLIPVGSTVRLVADVEPRDRYGRTLAYVYRADGVHVNLALARDGFALPLTIPPNVAHADAFVAAAAEARDAGRGLWSACEDEVLPPPSTTAAPSPGPTPGPGIGTGCDPAYPDVCIPPSPPDLDCADIPHRRFRVLPPDPHRFDGGGDGVGCESG